MHDGVDVGTIQPEVEGIANAQPEAAVDVRTIGDALQPRDDVARDARRLSFLDVEHDPHRGRRQRLNERVDARTVEPALAVVGREAQHVARELVVIEAAPLPESEMPASGFR